MPKIAKSLTALQVRRLVEQGTQGRHSVGNVAGLQLLIRGNAAAWVLRTTVGGKRKDVGLGGYPSVPLAGAVQRARELADQVFAGSDPVAERKERRKAVLTFAQHADAYIESHQAAWKNPKHAQQWRNTLMTWAVPLIGHLPVESITTAHVLEVLKQPVGQQGMFWVARAETASRVRQRIEAVIDAADAIEGRERLNPARLKSIERVLPAPAKVKRVKHHAAMPWQLLPKFMAELAQREGMAARALAWTILTAARSGETRGMTWGEIDLKRRLWIIPPERMKAGREHVVPVSDAALACLPPVGEPGDIVFPGVGGKPLSDMSLSAVLKRMGQGDVTVHGFRSTFRDWAGEETAHSREVIEAALAHRLGDSAEQAYARSDLRQKRTKLMEDWSDYAVSLVAATRPKVVQLRG